MANCGTSNARPLIVAGMHRSGTSYVASMLMAAGVVVGERLFGPTVANVRGHFEDLDFTALHIHMLQALGAPTSGWIVVNQPEIERRFERHALELVAARSHLDAWGWKDPRNTLFLDFWLRLAPDARFLFVYRKPWEVVDSLFRRGDFDITLDPLLSAKAWIEHNSRILRFRSEHPGRSLLVSAQRVAADPTGFTTLLRERFGLAVSEPQQNLFETSLLHSLRARSFEELAIATYVPRAVELYRELDADADFGGPDSPELTPFEPADLAVPVITHWQYIRSIENNARLLHLRTDQDLWRPASRD
jgi:O-antigen biosynthesis protein